VVVTSSPIMYVENFRPHEPGVTPDDVIKDSVLLWIKASVRSWT